MNDCPYVPIDLRPNKLHHVFTAGLAHEISHGHQRLSLSRMRIILPRTQDTEKPHGENTQHLQGFVLLS